MAKREQINLRLLHEERELLVRAAQAAGQTVTEFVRVAALAAAGALIRRLSKANKPAE